MVFRIYPTLRYLILLILGILSVNGYHWNLYWIAGAFIAVFISGLLAIKIPSLYFLRHMIPLSFFFLGIFFTQLYDERNQKDHLSKFESIEAVLVKIDSYTETKAKSYKAIAKVYAISQKSVIRKASGKMIVYFNKETGNFPKYGEIYWLKGSVREIEAPKNPQEFDYKTFQARKNIFNHQFVYPDDYKKVGESRDRGIFYWANQASNYTHSVFRAVTDTQEQLGVAEAIIGGMRSELTGEVRNWFTKTGTVHALAVSGMHVGILFMVLNFFLKFILNPKKLPFILTVLILLWTYAIFTGLSPSVSRATLMFSIFQVGIFIRRNGDYVNTLIFAALVLLMLVPTWVYDVGFQLSHLAVLGILVLYPYLQKIATVENKVGRWILDITMISIAAQIYTLPFTLYYFQQFPNYFLLANPVVSLLCIPILPVGFLTIIFYKVPLLGFVLGWVFKTLIQLMNTWVYWIYKIPFSVSEGISFYATDVILLFTALAFFQYFLKSRRVFYLNLTALTFFIMFSANIFLKIKQERHKELTFHYIPNGYGMSILDGRKATFISSDSLINEPLIYQYHLKSYYSHAGVKEVNEIAANATKNELFKSDDYVVFWIKTPTFEEHSRAGFTLVSNNALDVRSNLENTQIILDGSNRKWYIEKIKKKYKDAIVLYEQGSKSIN